MKYNIVFKSIALVLAACCLLGAGLCTLGIVAFSQIDLYGSGVEAYLDERREDRLFYLAEALLTSYAARTYSSMSPELLEYHGYAMDLTERSSWYGLNVDDWAYVIYPATGAAILESHPNYKNDFDKAYAFSMQTHYPEKVLDEESYYDFTFAEDGQETYYRWETSPTLRIDILINEEALLAFDDIPAKYITLAHTWQYPIIYLLLGFLGLFGVCVVYLCCAAGRNRKSTQLQPAGLNRLPLDVYAVAVGLFCFLCAWVVIEGFGSEYVQPDGNDLRFNWGIIALGGTVAFAAILSALGWCFALAAQIKMRNFYWWRHSLVGFCLGWIWNILKRIFRGIARIYALLPMIWQRVAIIAGFGLGGLFAFLLILWGAHFLGVLLLLALVIWGIAGIGYDIYAFGSLMAGAERMSKGDLHTQISTRYLFGSYKSHAEHLNAMANVASVAAQRQMRSERMKAELITNVSHDIKTPLTSLINYVDLLQQAHTPEEEAQYLEVLSRQSQRMKKLIEDLIDMSKASTGNMSVELGTLDAAEALNQALGEFGDKLALAQLTPVVSLPETPAWIQADGKLTWRVLSNLLSNVVKYSLPGTRVYADLRIEETKVLISLKNISREPLNVSADELTERFVRGDASRNTEGSGLGLNIAQSLMELQKGSLELLVDGDLFKVTVSFPAANIE